MYLEGFLQVVTNPFSYVLILAGAEPKAVTVTPEEALSLCRALIADGVRKKDAAKQVAQQTGLSAKELYAALIETP